MSVATIITGVCRNTTRAFDRLNTHDAGRCPQLASISGGKRAS
jgi:hypothetical protein